MQKHVNLVDLVKSFPTNIYLQNLASIQKRTSPLKFAHLAEKSEEGSISNLSTKVQMRAHRLPHDRGWLQIMKSTYLLFYSDLGRGPKYQNIKLWRARSPLYRHRSLQVNTNFAAFFEIYQKQL